MQKKRQYIRPDFLKQKIFELENATPRMLVERALLLTESFMETEGDPIFLRWAKALVHIMEFIPITMQPDDIIAGSLDNGRYGLFYPELNGMMLDANAGSTFSLFRSNGDLEVVQTSILPYWKGRTYHDGVYGEMPPSLQRLLSTGSDFSKPTFILSESATIRHSLQWVHDYGKVLEKGFHGIVEEAQAHLVEAVTEKQEAFYSGVILLCHGIREFAIRFARLAETLASTCTSDSQKAALLDMAARCRRVPWEPAESFADAIQSQWMTQLVSRLEAEYGGNISNGRMDQYFLPYYRQDKALGRLTDQRAREYLDALWCRIAQHVRLKISPTGSKLYQDCAHWEFTTIGGVLSSGEDATNELSSLILHSASEFPMNYPYLGIRVHSGMDKNFITEICSVIQNGKKSPVLLNDRTIIRRQVARGISIEEARNYAGSGFSEARLVNRDNYFVGSMWINLPSILEMACNDGYCSLKPGERFGLATGTAESIQNFPHLLSNFEIQILYFLNQAFQIQRIMEKHRGRHIASPLLSALHGLGMKYGMDISSSYVPEARSIGGFFGIIGFATVLDSLSAINTLVFEQHRLSLQDFVDIVNANFEGYEDIRQRCLAAPKYGTGNRWVDGIGRRIDRLMLERAHSEKNLFGGTAEIFYVPVRADIAMGSVSGATFDGRLAGCRFSSGTSPSLALNANGPTAALISEMMSQTPELNSMGARIMVSKFLPRQLCSPYGIEMLSSLILTWVEQEHWLLRLEAFDEFDISSIKAANEDTNIPLIGGMNIQGYGFSLENVFYKCPLRKTARQGNPK